MKRQLSFLALIFICYSANSQIVNVESIRRVSDTSKWSGFTKLTFDLTKNKNRIFNIQNKIHVQYLYDKNMVLFINQIDFKALNDSKLINKGIQHLRYNYQFNERFAWEIFAQTQYDQISEIDFRGLLGAGPRFKLLKSKDYNFHIGILSMYEYEKSDDDLGNIIHKSFRNSTYFSFSLFPKNTISIVSSTYYQPLYKKFKDYRISNDTSVAISIFKNLALDIGFTYIYDAFPAFGVPKEQYKLTNGLTYSFD